MERALVNAEARHPVRRAFPPVAEIPLAPAMPSEIWDNTRLFLMTFVAGFIAFYGMIA